MFFARAFNMLKKNNCFFFLVNLFRNASSRKLYYYKIFCLSNVTSSSFIINFYLLMFFILSNNLEKIYDIYFLFLTACTRTFFIAFVKYQLSRPLLYYINFLIFFNDLNILSNSKTMIFLHLNISFTMFSVRQRFVLFNFSDLF